MTDNSATPKQDPAPLAAIAQRSITAVDIDTLVARREAVKTLIRRVMKRGIHYGLLPGVDKPTIYKAGAEELLALFSLRAEATVKIEELQNGHRNFIVSQKIFTFSGAQVGEGIGSCSTMESRFRFRKAQRLCPKCGKPSLTKGKAQYGGGWICWKKKDGCDAKFQDGDQEIEGQITGQVENENIADCYNACLKQANIRSKRDAALSTTGSSDFFTQDDAGYGETDPAVIEAEPAKKETPLQTFVYNFETATAGKPPSERLKLKSKLLKGYGAKFEGDHVVVNREIREWESFLKENEPAKQDDLPYGEWETEAVGADTADNA